MHHFIYATKDAWISSGSNAATTGISEKDQNYGKDQILEIKKNFYNDSFDYQTRALIDFSGTEFTEMSKSIVDGTITNPKFYLRLYEAEGTTELSPGRYTLHFQPISQSWQEGSGKFGDNPKVTNGCSWENHTNQMGGTAQPWDTQTTVGNTFASGTLTIADGNFTNQEIRIGGVDFIFVTGSISNFDNNSSEIFVESGSSVNISANNLTGSINDNKSIHGLPITASVGGTGEVILSGSSTGSTANLSFGTSLGSVFSVNGNSLKALEGGTDIVEAVSGNGPSVLAVSSSRQSFSNQSPDVEADITDMVKMWLSGSYPNYGLVARFTGSTETDETTTGQLKFFSTETHTIYAPRLEVKWDDVTTCSGDNTGSMVELNVTGSVDNYVYPIGLKESYHKDERGKFKFGVRKRYIQKTFSESVQTVTGSYIPAGSGSYSIVDLATGETVVPFKDIDDNSYTSFGCDGEYNYFNQWLSGFETNRYYKILIKVKYDDKQEIIYDDDFEFKVVN